MADACRECGERISFSSIDHGEWAFHHLRHALDADHKAIPTNPTFRYLIDRLEKETEVVA